MTYKFPSKDSRVNWGFLGYEGAMCDRAVSNDNVDMLLGCIENDWMDADTQTIDNKTMIQYCRMKGADKCAAKLIEIGYK